jgi:hypothetical protein
LVTGEKWDYQKGRTQMTKPEKIIAFQLHYTSCRYGISGHAGFQTRAMSREINLEEQREVERLGTYQPPRNLPTDFNNLNLTDFPKAYRNIYLKNGKLAIIKSVYVGQDYTRRLGNYFSHVLIIEHLPDDIWPVDLYEWDGWKNKLLPAEDMENANFELPAITLIPDNKAYSFTKLQEFINKDTDRKTQLAYMIQAVFMRRNTSRNIVIKEDETNGLFWIACLQKSFPSHQKELDCSSYQFDPRACLAINITLGNTDFILGENERKYQFYVFDFIDNQISEVGSINEYATTISTWMCEQPDKLQDFYAFTRWFEHDSLNNELILLLHLFQLSIDKKLVLEEKKLVSILDFVNSYTKAEYLDNILQIIGSTELIKSENSAILIHLAHFFIKRKDSELVFPLIIYLLDNYLFTNDNFIGEIDALRSEAQKVFKSSYNKEFATKFLSKTHLSKITEKIDLLAPDKLSFTINELISSILTLDNQAKLYENKQLLEFIKCVVLSDVAQLNQLKWLLVPFIYKPIAFANICVYISSILENEAEESKKIFAMLLNNLFNKLGTDYRFNIINIMKLSPITWQVLEAEWKYYIEKQRDKIAAHASYYQHIFQDYSDYSQYYLPVFSEKLWELLSKKAQQIQAIIWVKEQQTQLLPPKLAKAIFQTVSEQISFDPKDKQSNELYQILVAQVNSRAINRLILKDAVIQTIPTNFNFDEPLDDIKMALTRVDEKTYHEFSKFYLPLILSRITQAKQHGLIIKTVFHSEYSKIFKHSYSLFYHKISAIKFDNADMAALMFWLNLNSDNEDYRTFLLIKEFAIDLLASRISKLKDKEYSRLLHEIKNEKDITEYAKEQWEQISSKVEEKRNTLFRRFLNKWHK